MSYIEQIIESNTNVVFCFGDKGVGKTCFLSMLIYYLYDNHQLKHNSKYNPEGIEYIYDLLDELGKGNLPEPTLFGNLREVDLQFKIDSKPATLTFLDMSGEELVLVKAGKKNPLTDQTSKGEMSSQLSRYFSNPDVNITILCFVEYSKAREHDYLMNSFFNFIESNYEFDFKRMAVIVTKWDQNKGGDNFLKFLSEKTPQSYFWLDQAAKMKNAFPFSIGELDPNNKQKIINMNSSYCENIVEWLHNTCSFQKYDQIQNDNFEKFEGKGKSFIKLILRIVTPIGEIREWFKIFFK